MSKHPELVAVAEIAPQGGRRPLIESGERRKALLTPAQGSLWRARRPALVRALFVLASGRQFCVTRVQKDVPSCSPARMSCAGADGDVTESAGGRPRSVWGPLEVSRPQRLPPSRSATCAQNVRHLPFP